MDSKIKVEHHGFKDKGRASWIQSYQAPLGSLLKIVLNNLRGLCTKSPLLPI